MGTLQKFLELVRFSHTFFALPFALAALIWASHGWPQLYVTLLILGAMVTCRNSAMAFNRLVDAKLDAKNPRTAKRHIPSGQLKPYQVWLFLFVNIGLFIWVCYAINQLAFILAIPALFAVFFYSLTKRFSDYSHLFLGFAIGISPIGAWIAVQGSIAAEALWLGMLLWLWIAGFDIIYATQDEDFDRREGLHSLVTRFGSDTALKIAAYLHLVVIILLWVGAYHWKLGLPFVTASLLISLLLIYLHVFRGRFRSGASLEKINDDFFLANIAVSFCVLFGIALSVIW